MKKIYLIPLLIFALIVGGFLVYQFKSLSQNGDFSDTAPVLSSTKNQEVVTLKNGDTYNLTASIVKKTIQGQEVKMLAYNGSIPGPLIKVPEGSEITLNFKNDTDVDSTIHSHGVRVENKFDGVVDLSQDPVKPGQSFTYKLRFPDVGVFWYHPHIREDYAQELGLYGNFLVTPNTPDYWAEVDREETLFLDDILIEHGKIAKFAKETVNHTLMGRFGNTMLVNGTENYQLSIKQGERVRFYITNAANTRVFNFTIPNARMKLVGSDNGKYEREEWVESVVIGPSERQIVEVWFDKDGDFSIQNQTPAKANALGVIKVEPFPVTTNYLLIPRTNQDVISAIDPLRSLFAKPADKELRLSLNMGSNATTDSQNTTMGGHMMEGGHVMANEEMTMDDVKKIEWEDDMGEMNAKSTKETLKWKVIDEATNKENMDIDWQFKRGDVVKIKIFNDDKSMHPMQHPIHIHGQKFLVLSTNGEPTKNLVWKDTALIQTGDSVELLVQMDNPGDWLIHCHIPEHMEAGMMSQFKVN
jgi:suppressor of ftsI